MAPEIALVYGLGLIPSALMSAVHFESQRRKQKTPALLQIQRNLKKLNLFWADYAGEIQSLNDSSPSQDFEKFKKGLIISSYFFISLSWIGLCFHLLLFISIKKWTRPRIERQLMESRLATEDLNENDTHQTLKELQSSI